MIKIINIVAPCSLVSEDPFGSSIVTFTIVFPNPNISDELTITSPPSGILGVVPVVSPPRSIIPPSKVMLQSMSVASAPPIFLITAFTLRRPPVIKPASSSGAKIVILKGSDQAPTAFRAFWAYPLISYVPFSVHG